MFESDAAAAEALSAAAAADAPVAPAPAAPAPAEQAPAQPTPNPVDAGTTQSSESFTAIDPSTLPPELQEHYKSMQGDYTRKTQEIAPFRKMLEESGLDPDQARQALEFVTGLQDETVQRQLFNELQTRFGGNPEEFGTDEYDETSAVDPRDRQIQELQDRLDGWERQQALSAAEMQLDRAEQAIRGENPSWSDDDIMDVKRMALSFNGDLMAAADYIKSRDQRILSSYVDGKGSVAAGTPSPMPNTGHAQTPHTFGDLDEATKAALETFGNDWQS